VMELRDYPAIVELIRRGGLKEHDATDAEARAFRLVHAGGPDLKQDGG
jgi:hypothetical protein